MATNKHIIDIQTKGAAKSKKDIQGISGNLSKMALRAGAVAGAFYAAKGLIQGITELSRKAAKVEALERGFDSLGKKLGFSSQSFNKLNNAVNGTMKQTDLMTEANNAMMLGVVKSDDEMAQLFDTAQRLGQALGVDTAQAIEVIKNFGLTGKNIFFGDKCEEGGNDHSIAMISDEFNHVKDWKDTKRILEIYLKL